MYRVVEALMELALDAGVEFEFDAPVERIDVGSDLARGVVREGGGFQQADAVVANADLSYIYDELLPKSETAARLARKRYSCSVVSFFWGVDKRYEALPPHTLFLADDFRGNFESIIDDLGLPQNPSLYIHAPAQPRDQAWRPRQDTLIAIVPVGHLSANGELDWPPSAIERGECFAVSGRSVSLIWNPEIRSQLHAPLLAKALQPDQGLHPRALPQPGPIGLLPAAQPSCHLP
jgi:phytoene dehydrogenase-like protein